MIICWMIQKLCYDELHSFLNISYIAEVVTKNVRQKVIEITIFGIKEMYNLFNVFVSHK